MLHYIIHLGCYVKDMRGILGSELIFRKLWRIISYCTFYLPMQYMKGRISKRRTQILPHAEQFIRHHHAHVPVPENINTEANC